MLIEVGTQERVIAETTLASGTTEFNGSIKSDAILATLWVDSVTSGSLTVSVYTLTDEGKEAFLFSFPTISAPTASLVLKKSGVLMQRFLIRATYTGVCSYEIYVRAISNSGESTARILGSDNWEVSQEDVTTAPAILIPAALIDRQGLLVKNWSSTATIYIGEILAKADITIGYPLGPKDALSLDISAGSEVYAVADAGIADIRIAQAGG